MRKGKTISSFQVALEFGQLCINQHANYTSHIYLSNFSLLLKNKLVQINQNYTCSTGFVPSLSPNPCPSSCRNKLVMLMAKHREKLSHDHDSKYTGKRLPDCYKMRQHVGPAGQNLTWLLLKPTQKPFQPHLVYPETNSSL